MKQCKDLTVVAAEYPAEGYVLLRLTDSEPLPEIRAGQFVEVRVADSPHTFLRRPISVNYICRERNELWLLIRVVGEGTRHLSALSGGDRLNVLFPLGNGFTPGHDGGQVLLVGGGVGIAPLLEYGRQLCQAGAVPTFLLGGRSKKDLLQMELFEQFGPVYVTTEDGSRGQRGFVTDSPLLAGGLPQDMRIACCGPKPMMMAVARYAKGHGLECEVSLENMMACGLGACLCCVEHTLRGNVCVCTEGPVFNITELTWQI